MTYAEKLRSPLWQRKRLKIMERDNFKCTHCGVGDKTLNVHHGYYESNKNPWDYADETLHTLCEKCHHDVEKLKRIFNRVLGSMNMREYVLFMRPMLDMYRKKFKTETING